MQSPIRAEPNVTPMIDVMLVLLIIDRQPVSEADLASRVRAIYAHSNDHVLFVRADRDLDYARVLDAIDIVRQNGVRMVGVIAEPPLQTVGGGMRRR